MQSHGSRRHLNAIFRVTLSIAIVGALAYFVGTSETLAQLKSVRWQIIALVTVILASHVFVVAPRWATILAALGSPMRSSALIGSVFLGFLFNQLLPTAVGGDALRAWRARRLGAPLDLAIHSVLLDRVSGIVVVLAGSVILLPFMHLPVVPDVFWWMAATGIIGGLIGCASLWALGTLPPIHVPVIGSLQRMLVDFNASAGVLLRHWRAALSVIAYAIMGQMIVVLAIWLLANEVRIHLPLVDITVVTFGAMLASAIPISVAGWGLREGALIFLFGAYGVPADKTFAVSVLFGACMMVASLPGAFVLLDRRAGPMPSAND